MSEPLKSPKDRVEAGAPTRIVAAAFVRRLNAAHRSGPPRQHESGEESRKRQ